MKLQPVPAVCCGDVCPSCASPARKRLHSRASHSSSPWPPLALSPPRCVYSCASLSTRGWAELLVVHAPAKPVQVVARTLALTEVTTMAKRHKGDVHVLATRSLDAAHTCWHAMPCCQCQPLMRTAVSRMQQTDVHCMWSGVYEWNEVGHAYSHAPPDMSGAQRRSPLNRVT
jgi:hypothetical protein